MRAVQRLLAGRPHLLDKQVYHCSERTAGGEAGGYDAADAGLPERLRQKRGPSRHGHGADRIAGAQLDVQNTEGQTALYIAAQENHPTVVGLVNREVDLTLKCADSKRFLGMTPGETAVFRLHDACWKLLLENELMKNGASSIRCASAKYDIIDGNPRIWARLPI